MDLTPPSHSDVPDAPSPTTLQASLTSLSELRLDAAGLDVLLIKVAELAVGVVPGADGAGLTLFRPGRADTLVATDTFAARVDTVQYAVGQGPCIMACDEGRTIRSGSVVTDPRWPEFGSLVVDLDLGSVLSLPLKTGGEIIGSINLYAHESDAFSAVAGALGESFVAPAAVAAVNARVMASAASVASELQVSLAARATVDQAIGIVLFTERITAEEARRVIEERASAEGTSVLDLARTIVDTTLGKQIPPA